MQSDLTSQQRLPVKDRKSVVLGKSNAQMDPKETLTMARAANNPLCLQGYIKKHPWEQGESHSILSLSIGIPPASKSIVNFN